MQEVQPSLIHRWVSAGGTKYPKNLGLRCGHCGERSQFVIDDPAESVKYGGPPVRLPCPNCRQAVILYAVHKPRATTARNWLFVHPHAQERQRLDLSSLNWPEPLAKAYEECNAALDAGLWTAAAGQARRTLEGVIKHLVGGDHKKPLGALLRQLPSSVQLDRPIQDAADVLREGGNMASHFNLSASPDAAVAKALLQLLDDLIEYLFLLPENVAELRQQLSAPEAPEPASDSGD